MHKELTLTSPHLIFEYICCNLIGSYIIANPASGQNSIHYTDRLGDGERILTYFEITKTGVMRHFSTGKYVMSEGSHIDVGYTLALKDGPTPEDAYTIQNFGFSFTDTNLWKHNLSGLYIQPEGNSVHNGAKLAAHKYDEERSQTYATDIQFVLENISYEQLKLDMNAKKVADEELAFLNSSDGLALASANAGNQDTEIIQVSLADPAMIELGVNRLIVATYANPVLNLSLNLADRYSITESADSEETWSLVKTSNTFPSPPGKNIIYSNEIQIVNEVGKCLACNVQGELCCDSEGPGTIWDILQAETGKYFIVSHHYPYTLARFYDKLMLVPKNSDPTEGTLYWTIYNA